MGRKRKGDVKYWPSWNGYGAWIGGKQVALAYGPDDKPFGPTWQEAIKEYGKRLALETGKGTDRYLVSSLMNQYRIALAERRESQVPTTFDSLAKSFCSQYGHLEVADLRPFHVEDFLRNHRPKRKAEWNGTTKH